MFFLVILLALAGVLFGIIRSDMRPVLAVIYFAFGFGLQRASFCGAALISRAVLFRDRQGLVAIGIAVLTALLGIGLLDVMGLITVEAEKVAILPAVIGGLAFGIGMVLAGGCISGSLFKATEGRFPSLLAVGGILVGIVVATSGPGTRLRALLTNKSPTLSLSSNLADATGVSFSILAPALAVSGLVLIAFLYRQKLRREFKLGSFALDRGWPLLAIWGGFADRDAGLGCHVGRLAPRE